MRNEKGEVIISDTTLRDNLPFNLWPIQERHKQVCGCTLCTVMEEYHTSLRKFRLNFVDHLIGVDQARADRYKAQVFPSGMELKQRASHVRTQIMCSVPVGSFHHKWMCVMGRCESCPGYTIPDEEKDVSAQSPQIHFQTYKKVTKCSIHGILDEGMKGCPACTASLEVEGGTTGKVTIRDRLTDMHTSITSFHTDYYGPMLQKYKYHYGLVKMLSKKLCFERRKITFEAADSNILMRRDYAKCLSAKFNKEMQSDHFGQGTTLSMEGCFVEYLATNGEVHAHFHSHMADKSNQDAAATHAHMRVLLNF